MSEVQQSELRSVDMQVESPEQRTDVKDTVASEDSIDHAVAVVAIIQQSCLKGWEIVIRDER